MRNTKFWEIIRKWSQQNIVVISEETAPKDFKCIWKKNYSRGRGFKSNKGGKNVVEKLFIHISNYNKLYDKIKKLNKIKLTRKDKTIRKKRRNTTKRKKRKKNK